MRPKTIILFVIAVACGLVASIGVSQYMQTAAGSAVAVVETATIFVAVTDINIGEKLDAQNVKLEEWPKDRVPEGAITELDELEDRFPRQRLYVGEPILTAKLMDGNDRGSPALTIPKGFRVVSVKVTVESSVSGMVQPGDRVDLLVFLRKSNEIPETGTRTILKDVNIFSVDGATERSTDANGQQVNVRSVSLLVKPEQAESVMLASELGRLSLSLRRPDDTSEDASGGETIQSLLGAGAGNPNDRRPKSEDGGFVGWLSSQSETPADTQQPPAQQVPVDQEPEWTMQILTPSGHREFRWLDAAQLPVEVTADSDSSPAAAIPAAQPIAAPLNGTPSPPPTADTPLEIVEDLEEAL